jgi:flagellar motor switch protein FliG
MSNLRQAAVLVANLPPKQSAALLAKLNPEHSQAIHDEMARALPNHDEFHLVVSNFLEDFATATAVEKCSLSEVLADIDNQTLLATIIDEHPQTIALVLGSLPRPRAVKLLGAFPAALQADLVRRIAAILQPSPEIIREVAIGLRSRLHRAASRNIENRAA